MSSTQDIIAEQTADLNAKGNYQTKGKGSLKETTTADESNVNELGVEGKFPGATVVTGRDGQGEDSAIPEHQGGDDLKTKAGGDLTKAHDFEGPGGPETKIAIAQDERPGDDDVPTKNSN